LSITKDKLLATSYDLLHDPILSDYSGHHWVINSMHQNQWQTFWTLI